MADSTSAAREAAIEASVYYLGDSDRCRLRDDGDFGAACYAVQKAFIDGAQWARSQPRVVSEAAVEAAVQAYGARTCPCVVCHDLHARDMRLAFEAAYAVEEQRK